MLGTTPSSPSPALAAQHHDHYAVAGDSQGEDESVDHGQEDLLQVRGHHLPQVTRLVQVRPKLPRTRTRTRACVVVFIVQQDMLETNGEARGWKGMNGGLGRVRE